MGLPLEGIRVVDLTHYQQGPYSTAMMGDTGRASPRALSQQGFREPHVWSGFRSSPKWSGSGPGLHLLNDRSRRLAYYLAQEGYRLSVFGAYRVLQRAGLAKKRCSRPRKKPQSYAMAVPGQRVQVDVKYLPPLRLFENITTNGIA